MTTKKLIIVSDDFGYSPGTNQAIIECFTHGLLSSAAVMVNTPYLLPIQEFHTHHPEFDLGIHLVAEQESEVTLEHLEQQLIVFQQTFKQAPSFLSFHASRASRQNLTPELTIQLNVYLSDLARRYQRPVRNKQAFHIQALASTEHYEQSWDKLTTLITALVPGLNVIIVHVGQNPDPFLQSSYIPAVRDVERRLLLSPELANQLRQDKVELTTFQAEL